VKALIDLIFHWKDDSIMLCYINKSVITVIKTLITKINAIFILFTQQYKR